MNAVKVVRPSRNITIQGPLRNRSATSRLKSACCRAGGSTRSRVVVKQTTNSSTARMPHTTMLNCQPRRASPAPSRPTSQGVAATTTTPPLKPPMKRSEDSAVRCRLSEVITPISAEYGMLMAVYASIRKLNVA